MSFTSQQLEREQYLIGRLGQHGANVDAGVTTPQIRMERMREAIAEVGPGIVIGRGKDRKPITYAQVFQQIYNQPYLPIERHESNDGV
jgi:hypothetical protein